MTNGSLLAEIERDLLDAKSLADLLRKCMLLGARSGSAELRAWASKELRGYDADEELPTYRIITAPILLDATTGNTWYRGQNVPESALPDIARERGLGNKVDLRQGVGELQAWADAAGTKGISISFPGADVIGSMFDKKSGNPWQHTERIYWSVSAPSIHGVIDNVRTTLTELITELVSTTSEGQDVPTADQTNNAVNVAVHGGRARVVVSNSQASGGSTISTQERGVAENAEGEPGWWTFGRKVWATVVSIFVVVGAVAAVIVLFH